MRRFARLCDDLGGTTSSSRKVALLAAYLRTASPADAALATSYLLGSGGRRPVSSTALRTWASEEAAIPHWLFDACYESVGDLGETLALVVPEGAVDDDDVEDPTSDPLSTFVRDHVRSLVRAEPSEARRIVCSAWRRLRTSERFLYHKLIGGAFRMGVAKGLVVRAIAEATGLATDVVAHRLAGPFDATADGWANLVRTDAADALPTRPYPFCLAAQLDQPPESLGPTSDWLIERKFDGIRAQLLRRGDHVAVVSRGEERIDAGFPELVALARTLPSGTVLDGEVLLVEGRGLDARILPFHRLQTRIHAKRGAWTAERGLFDLEAIRFVAYDLLESDGVDLRSEPLSERRRRLDLIVAALVARGADDLVASPLVDVATWEEARAERARSRLLGVEGLMLKRKDAAYGIGRERSAGWWKWKVDPYAIDAVLVASQPGSGRRANLLTDHTFAVWRDEELVVVAKAYSGLTDEELHDVDRIARRTTIERKGPVRLLEPTLVFELGFEGIERSTRHKAGVALRFPRMLRWRRDKTPADADRIETLEGLLRVRE